MSGTGPITAGSVIIGPADCRLIVACIARVQHSRRIAGKRPSARLAALLDVLADAGQPDDPTSRTDHAGVIDLVDVNEAARLLGCSTRTARRLAPRLDGRLVAGRWMLDRIAIEDHLKGTTQ